MRSAAALLLTLTCQALFAADRPNVLWISSEDNGPHLGCYGDEYSITPNLDELAERACRYNFCWSNAPVCAPARTTIITGMYANSIGAEHMRSLVPMPKGALLFPEYLRQAGYYCTNNVKEDYNVQKSGQEWDESSNRAHWQNRAEGQPFFAVFNHTISHESQIRNEIAEQHRIHDPAQVRIPAYHPDAPEVRKDWAQYYDRITMMDAAAGRNLQELEAAGLADDTIIFYFGDHGSGMPRNKRWLYNSGLHVPLLVHIPEKWRSLATDDFNPGGTSDRLVSFVDFAPTVLSLCGVEPPAHMQGRAFLGPFAGEQRDYVYGFRGRMDERIDLLRSVSDGRYVYIRNYMPHRIYGQHLWYMFETPTTRVWHAKHLAGELNEEQSHFWERKPAEELYDLRNDPDEVHNLAADPKYVARLVLCREALRAWEVEIRDVGFLPESVMHERAAGGSPYDYARTPEYHLDAVLHTLDVSTSGWFPFDQTKPFLIQKVTTDQDAAVRFWSAVGLLAQDEAGVAAARAELHQALKDESPAVRIVTAEALGRFGDDNDLAAALPVLLDLANIQTHGLFVAVPALNAIDALDDRAASIEDDVAALPRKAEGVPQRLGDYADRLIQKTLSDLNQPNP